MLFRFLPSARGWSAFSFSLTVLLALFPAFVQAQIPDQYENLHVLPEDITRDELVQTMRNFSMALGVRCEHCHVSNGPSFSDMDFPSDAKPEKEKARFMMNMLRQLNRETLASMEHRGDPPVTMTCKTCHRGTPRPFLLSQELLMAAHEGGGEAAVARYRELRERYEVSGAYDFGETETSEVANQLAEDGRYDDAIVLMKLNAEMNPESSNIQVGLGQLYEESGDRASAVAAYEAALKLAPGNRRILQILERLKEDG